MLMRMGTLGRVILACKIKKRTKAKWQIQRGMKGPIRVNKCEEGQPTKEKKLQEKTATNHF